MKIGTKTIRAGDLRAKTVDAINKRNPKYIGFLEIEYIPERTSDETCSGNRGSTVVLCRLNSTTPLMQKYMPTQKDTIARTYEIVLQSEILGSKNDRPHIINIIIIVKRRGGTRSFNFVDSIVVMYFPSIMCGEGF